MGGGGSLVASRGEPSYGPSKNCMRVSGTDMMCKVKGEWHTFSVATVAVL